MKKIYCLNQISPMGLKRLEGVCEITDNIMEADGILLRSAQMHGREIPDGLLAVARAGAGVNNIPIEEYAKKGIVVFNTPGANSNAVKELVIAGMLMAARDIYGGIEWLETRQDYDNIAKDAEEIKKNFAGTEIYGKTLGVIGLGAIGVRIANAAVDLGMQVLGYDPYLSVSAAWKLSRHVEHCSNMDDLYAKCDYITIHVPATKETIGIINKDAISKMKPAATVLNFSRDVLVDEDAVEEALREGRLHRYVTDFPNPKSVKMKGAIVLPHLGASTEESEENCAVMAVKELIGYLNYGNIKNSVNYPSCCLETQEGVTRIAIFNENVPNMIGQYTSLLALHGVNILDMSNKSRGGMAYTILNVEGGDIEAALEGLKNIKGVYRVRVI